MHHSFKIKNRCVFSNRSRAIFSKLKVTRMVFKNLATHGYLNGVKKHSW
jgi:ribosomal protein S14